MQLFSHRSRESSTATYQSSLLETGRVFHFLDVWFSPSTGLTFCSFYYCCYPPPPKPLVLCARARFWWINSWMEPACVCNAAASLQHPQSPTRGAASLEKYIYSQNKKRQRRAQTRPLYHTGRTSIDMFSVETVQRVCGQRRSSRKQARFTCAGLNIPTWLAACFVTGKSWSPEQLKSGTKCVKVQWKSTWSYR